MRLIGCGDSWCWGAELVDPKEEPVPIMNLPGGGFDRQLKPINIEYRLKHRYLNLFADSIGAIKSSLKDALQKYNNYRPHFNLHGLTPSQYINNIHEVA